MKALTLWQPWASLMADGFKKVETRTWATKYRGPIAIHSAKNVPSGLGASQLLFGFRDFYTRAYNIHISQFEDHAAQLPTGCVLCIADLVAIEETTKVRADIALPEFAFGNYDDGRYAWFFENLRKLTTPLPCAGNRLLWNLDMKEL
jgi:hypothetical protein